MDVDEALHEWEVVNDYAKEAKGEAKATANVVDADEAEHEWEGVEQMRMQKKLTQRKQGKVKGPDMIHIGRRRSTYAV